MTTANAVSAVLLDGRTDASRDELGGKAWGINRMRRLGLPVPPAFVIPTSACRGYLHSGDLPSGLDGSLHDGIGWLETATDRVFGGTERPLLVSVRSGAAVSMPGMMDTILNLGITDDVAAALERSTGDAAWVADIRARFVDQHLKVLDGRPPQTDPWAQLRDAVEAVFRSWTSPRAVAYRRHHGLDDESGTAVTVQAMVFGNADDRSGTGVLFTRNPLTGQPGLFGEWLPRAQGEDVVAGVRTPFDLERLATALPDVHAQLIACAELLEDEARDVQDIEFTVESGRLHLLQTRAAKRTPRAAVRTAVAFVREGRIGRDEALRRISPEQARAAARRDGLTVDPHDAVRIATGLPACEGFGSGIVVTDPDTAMELAEERPVVLVRPTTSPEDVPAMLVAAALVTEHGGATSHAALVSREIGLPCVVACGDGVAAALVGRTVTVDGTAGAVYDGDLVTDDADGSRDDELLRELTTWACAQLGRAVADPAQLPELLEGLQSRS